MSSIKVRGLTLTTGNSKLGRVLNISLPPGRSCDVAMPCFCTKQCYALRHAYLRHKNARAAWDGNYEVWCADGPFNYFSAIKEAITKQKPKLFRWHVGGDIPSGIDGSIADAYIGGMVDVADHFPNTLFWTFTKRYDAARRNAKLLRSATNLNVLLSAWPGVKLDGRTRRAWPVCYVYDPKNPDRRIPKDAFPCSSECDKCLTCSALKAGEAVVITAH